jgi:hypothetical protein
MKTTLCVNDNLVSGLESHTQHIHKWCQMAWMDHTNCQMSDGDAI